jgi:hypothetical protein
MTGVDLAREVQALQPELVVQLVSGYGDARTATGSATETNSIESARLVPIDDMSAAARLTSAASPKSTVRSLSSWPPIRSVQRSFFNANYERIHGP